MIKFELKPLLDRFNEYISLKGSEADAVGARKEFSDLIKVIFVSVDCSKLKKEELIKRKNQHDSFLMICDALNAAEDEKTTVIFAIAYAGRASVNQALGDMDAAAKDYRRSADVAAGFRSADEVRIASVVNLSNVYNKMNRLLESIQCLSEAERIILRISDESQTEKLMSLKTDRGCIQCRLQMLSEAMQDFDDAIALYDNNPDRQDKMSKHLLKTLANRCGVLVNLKRYEEARVDGLRAVEIEGERISATTPVVLTNLAAACKCLGYFDEAERHYTRVVMIKKVSGAIATPAGRIDLGTILMGRGEVRLRLNRAADARDDLSEAIALFQDLLANYEKVVKPRLIGALKNRAEAYKALGDGEKSQKDLLQAENLAGMALD